MFNIFGKLIFRTKYNERNKNSYINLGRFDPVIWYIDRYIAKSNCTILTTDSKAIPKSFFDRLEIANNLRDKLRKII